MNGRMLTLKHFRYKNKLIKKELAGMIAVTPATLSKCERLYTRKNIVLLLVIVILGITLSACGTNSVGPVKEADTAETVVAKADLKIMDDAVVSYLGPEGTYTEEATLTFFDDAKSLIPETTVDDAIENVENGSSDYAVIPQENTLGGVVTNYVDALISHDDLSVVGEVILPINQTLMGVPGARLEDIHTVCSHSQGLTQSEEWRKENLPNAETNEMKSTAAAAKYVAESGDKTLAAIAAYGAAELYGLSVLAENVQITDTNKTRFYVLSRTSLKTELQTNAVLVASCEANRIDDIIVDLHNAGLELVTIHDRPEGSKLGMYNYIIEVKNGSGITEKMKAAIDSIADIQYRGSFAVIEK